LTFDGSGNRGGASQPPYLEGERRVRLGARRAFRAWQTGDGDKIVEIKNWRGAIYAQSVEPSTRDVWSRFHKGR
jgi:hypothetical protein